MFIVQMLIYFGFFIWVAFVNIWRNFENARFFYIDSFGFDVFNLLNFGSSWYWFFFRIWRLNESLNLKNKSSCGRFIFSPNWTIFVFWVAAALIFGLCTFWGKKYFLVRHWQNGFFYFIERLNPWLFYLMIRSYGKQDFFSYFINVQKTLHDWIFFPIDSRFAYYGPSNCFDDF